MVIRSNDHTVTWSYGHTIIWSYDHMTIGWYGHILYDDMMIPNPNHTVETALRFRRKRRGEEKEKDSPALHHKNYHRIMARMAMKRLALEYRRRLKNPIFNTPDNTQSLLSSFESDLERTRDVFYRNQERSTRRNCGRSFG